MRGHVPFVRVVLVPSVVDGGLEAGVVHQAGEVRVTGRRHHMMFAYVVGEDPDDCAALLVPSKA